MGHPHQTVSCSCEKKHKGNHSHGNCNCSKCKGSHASSCYLGCNPPKKHTAHFEEKCEDITTAGSSVRYKANCNEESNLIALGIGKGYDYDTILDRMGKLIVDMNFLGAPSIPGYPHLLTYESIILYLLQRVEALEQKVTATDPCLN
jgi:hypothetical protein